MLMSGGRIYLGMVYGMTGDVVFDHRVSWTDREMNNLSIPNMSIISLYHCLEIELKKIGITVDEYLERMGYDASEHNS